MSNERGIECVHETRFVLKNLTVKHMTTILAALEASENTGIERQEIICTIRTELSMAGSFPV